MKKLLLSALGVMLFAGVSMAQTYKPFKLGFGIGYTMPSDGGGGILIDVEPAYRINDAIAVGLRIESAAMAKNVSGSSATVSANGSYTLNGQYYFSDSKVRPYAGLGLGIFSIASIAMDNSSGAVAGGSKLGFYPRVGLDLGHFNINLDYNLVPASKGVEVASTGASETKIKNSYLGIRMGFFVFGGKN